MRILTSSIVLDRSGVPTYTLAMVRELQRRGHEVYVYSPRGGHFAEALQAVSHLNVPTPDAIIAQHTTCAYDMRRAFPNVPFLYSAHGTLPTDEQPPIGIAVDHYIAINTFVRDHLIAHDIPAERITIVRDFIDTTRFTPREPLRSHTPRVLFISNYKKWRNYRMLSHACADLQLPLKCVGAPYGHSRDLVADINNADLVVSWGRGILEAMSCGRPVLSYDKIHGDGYLTKRVYYDSREHNFAWDYACKYTFDVDLLKQHLQKYNPADGSINRALIEREHDVRTGVHTLLRVIASVTHKGTA